MKSLNELKKRIKQIASDQLKAELTDLLEDVEYEIQEMKTELDDANTEISNLEDQEAEYENSIDLGLDTIHFTFDKNNLQIRQQFDSLMQVLCKTPNKVI